MELTPWNVIKCDTHADIKQNGSWKLYEIKELESCYLEKKKVVLWTSVPK